MKVQQVPRGDTASQDAYVGPPGQLTMDSDRHEGRLHDGVTPGGHRLLNSEQINLLGAQAYTDLLTQSVPGVIDDSAWAKFNSITVAGDYTLPLLASADVGTHLWLQAALEGVTILVQEVGSTIVDKGSSDTSMSLVADEAVWLVKHTPTAFKVLGRY